MSEQFENSIRKKLEEVDIPFDPAAWDKMKKRLDDSDRRRPVFWWWTSGFLLLLLLGGGGWWWYAGSNGNDVNKLTITEAPISKEINSSVENVNKPNENTAEKNNAPGKVTEEKTTPTEEINVTGKITEERITPTEKINASEKTTNTKIAPTEKIITASKITGTKTTQTEKITASETTPDSKTTSAEKYTATNNSTPLQELTPARYNIQPIPFNQLPDIYIPATVNNSPVINIRRDTTANNYTKKEKKKRSGFDGGITLGPDYNIAPSFQMGKLGFNGGLFLRYHVNNRLSLSVAAVYAKKIYGATPKDYKFDYPVNYIKIDADCNVLDVPLNVNYTFRETPKSTWSAMAGASSYFMLKEKYDYYWANNTKRTREFNNQNQHYFSVLNLGVTYERKTQGRLKWGLQPYVKVPLNGVGEGKVKLSSAGVSLQLSLGKKD